MTFKNPQAAFEAAINNGRLSDLENAPNYAGKYMYMGTTDDGLDHFKNIVSRQYLKGE
jgi:hypothetical protein